MSDKLTQQEIDQGVAEIKEVVEQEAEKRGVSIPIVLMMLAPVITEYETEMRPFVLEQGLKIPTISELFGVNISIREVAPEESSTVH